MSVFYNGVIFRSTGKLNSKEEFEIKKKNSVKLHESL